MGEIEPETKENTSVAEEQMILYTYRKVTVQNKCEDLQLVLKHFSHCIDFADFQNKNWEPNTRNDFNDS